MNPTPNPIGTITPVGFGTPGADFGTEVIILSLIKLLFLLAFGIYVAFAFIATRQIRIMRKTVITPYSDVVELIGYVHFGASVLVFLATLFMH